MKSDFFKKLFFYILIGLLGVVVDTLVSNFFYNFVLQPLLSNGTPDKDLLSLEATISATLGGIAGLINNFVLNEYFVYKKEGNKKVVAQRFTKYFITILIGTFFIGKFLIFNLFFSVLQFGFTTSNLIAIAAGTLINYPINYFWTWGEFSFSKNLKNFHKKSN